MSVNTPAGNTPPSSEHHHGFDIDKRRSRWPLIISSAAVIAVVAGFAGYRVLGDDASPNEVQGATLEVVTAEGNASEQRLVEFVAEEIAPDYNIEIAFRGLEDSNTLNRAVHTGEVAGTIYQHELWLGQVLDANPDFELEAATPVFRWGFGIYSSQHDSIEELPDGANVSLYSDPANEAQGLWLLESAGLIELDDSINKWEATQDDIVANPKDLEFTLLDFAAQARALDDLDATVGYIEYYSSAGVSEDLLIHNPLAPDEFAGQLTISSRWKDEPNIQNLVAAFQDERVQDFLRDDAEIGNNLRPLEE